MPSQTLPTSPTDLCFSPYHLDSNAACHTGTLPLSLDHQGTNMCSSYAVCTNTTTCPDKDLGSGVVVPASGCTHNSIEPQKGDVRKRMGCFCGGMPGDLFSSYVCDTAQPSTHWLVQLIASENATDLTDGTPFDATLYERAGTPPSVRYPCAAQSTSASSFFHSETL